MGLDSDIIWSLSVIENWYYFTTNVNEINPLKYGNLQRLQSIFRAINNFGIDQKPKHEDNGATA